MFYSYCFPNGKLQKSKIGNLKKELEARPVCLRGLFSCLTVVEEKQKVSLGSLLSHLGILMLSLPS